MKLKRIWTAWDTWWLGDVAPHPLALVRIAAGTWLFGYWLIKLPGVPMLFSDQGITIPIVTRGPALLLVALQLPPASVAYGIYAVLLLALCGLALGWRSQLMAVIAFTLSVYFWMISLHLYGSSFDMLYLFLLFSLMFSDAGGTYSLDMKLRHGSWTAWKPVCALSQRLIAVQVTATYTGVCWQKFVLEQWQGGEVLYYNMMSIWATPPAFWFVKHVPWMPVYDALVHGVEFLQFIIPIGLWTGHLRPVGVAAGIVFHCIIVAFLGMGWFLVMPPTYVLFPRPESVRDALFRRFPSLAGPEVR
ncbi:MAG TPA: HTTM domain-containing protein [Candidatus Peribacteria bacterium]|nr:HTTM domain-containing protein [Candidatus Peribacteria bacterium]